MPKGYWIVSADVFDLDKYKAYQAANVEPFKKYDARFLVRGGRSEIVEGVFRSRKVVIEFPSYDAAMACWKSPEYQKAIELRKSVSSLDLVVVEGYEG